MTTTETIKVTTQVATPDHHLAIVNAGCVHCGRNISRLYSTERETFVGPWFHKATGEEAC
jgi:hypothetical protein